MYDRGYKIYLIGNKPDVNRILTSHLQHFGCVVKSFLDHNHALQHIADDPDLWITDIMSCLADNSILRKIKSHNHFTPVMLISDLGLAFDKLIEIDFEYYDDYIVKPFSPLELIMRAQKLLKKKIDKQFNIPEILYFNEYEINLSKRLVTFKGETINLTTKEFDLIYLLASNPRRTFSRGQLIKFIRGDNYCGSDRAVDDMIRRPRAKLRKFKIVTVYGYGYRVKY